MKGLEIARAFYEEYGRPVFEKAFENEMKLAAAALIGSGSECMGWDDDISRDHDFEPGFCIFLPDEDVIDRRTAFRMERAYHTLPAEYGGLKRAMIGPAGGQRRGVIRLKDFLMAKTGTPDGDLSRAAWFAVPEESLLEVTDGEVWRDDRGMLTGVREKLSFLPQDVRLKKLAGELMNMSISGQYNYERCLARGERGAAQLCLQEYVRSGMHICFLLNGRYMPYYKWAFRALRELGPQCIAAAERFEALISVPNDPVNAEKKLYIMADTAQAIADELQEKAWTDASCCDLRQHALSVNDRIEDPTIRNAELMAGV